MRMATLVREKFRYNRKRREDDQSSGHHAQAQIVRSGRSQGQTLAMPWSEAHGQRRGAKAWSRAGGGKDVWGTYGDGLGAEAVPRPAHPVSGQRRPKTAGQQQPRRAWGGGEGEPTSRLP